MKIHRVAAFAILAAVAYLSAQANGEEWTTRPAWWQKSLERHLMQLGEELDCYFTLEAYRPNVGYAPGKPVHFFEEESQLVGNPTTIEGLVKELRTLLPNVVVHRSKVDQRIIHLAEHRVVHRDDYSLNAKATLEFTGVLGRLPSAIGQQRPQLGEWARMDGRSGFNDSITEVSLSVEDEQIRTILTRAVPLEGYQRILWRAITHQGPRMSNGTFGTDWPETLVQYYGPYASRPTYYSFYLTDMGHRLKCHFTIERIALPRKYDEHMDGLYLVPYYLEPDYSVTTVDELVAHLRAQLKGMHIERSKRIPNVVHLIERPLLDEADYVLDRKATVTFQGKAGSLPWAIGKVKPGISWDPTSSDGPEGADWGRADWETEVTVDCVDKPIRDILTQHLPLDTYQPLLWRSVKYDTTVPSRTIVRYLGTTPVDDAEAPMGR